MTRVTQRGYFAATARKKCSSAWLKHFAAQLLQLRLPDLTMFLILTLTLMQHLLICYLPEPDNRLLYTHC